MPSWTARLAPILRSTTGSSTSSCARYGVRTKTEAVHLALRHSAGQPLTTNEMLSMQGAQLIGEIPADTGLQHFDSVG